MLAFFNAEVSAKRHCIKGAYNDCVPNWEVGYEADFYSSCGTGLFG